MFNQHPPEALADLADSRARCQSLLAWCGASAHLRECHQIWGHRPLGQGRNAKLSQAAQNVPAAPWSLARARWFEWHQELLNSLFIWQSRSRCEEAAYQGLFIVRQPHRNDCHNCLQTI